MTEMTQNEIECPFCEKGTIKVLHRPPVLKEMRKSPWGGCKKSYKMSKEIYEILNDCPNCGKSKKEIEKRLKHGKEPSREDVIKRLREAGIDPTKLR